MYLRDTLLLLTYLICVCSLRTVKVARTSLLETVRLPQSKKNRVAVEALISELKQLASLNPRDCLKPLAGGSFRTVWTSVSADSLLGMLLKQSPANIAGGDSWQVMDKGLTIAENIVYWKPLNVRMVGRAAIKPFSSGNSKGMAGYDLTIKGLQFRYGVMGVPEANFKIYDPLVGSTIGEKVTVLDLKEDQTLS